MGDGGRIRFVGVDVHFQFELRIDPDHDIAKHGGAMVRIDLHVDPIVIRDMVAPPPCAMTLSNFALTRLDWLVTPIIGAYSMSGHGPVSSSNQASEGRVHTAMALSPSDVHP